MSLCPAVFVWGVLAVALALTENTPAKCAAASGNCAAGHNSESLLLQVSQAEVVKVDAPPSPPLQKSQIPTMPPPFVPHSQIELSDSPTDLMQMGTSEESPSAAEMEHFRLLKELRTQGFACQSKSFPGIPYTEDTFKFDCRLWRAARYWSSKMGAEGFFSHEQGNSNPCTRSQRFGLFACAENIAAGNSGPADVLQQWKDSDGHCTNMMNPDFNRFGVGYVMTPGSPFKHYWTQSLGEDGDPADESCLTGQPGIPSNPVTVTRPVSPGIPSNPVTQPVSPEPPTCVDDDIHCESSYGPYCDLPHVKKLCKKTCGCS